MEDDSTEKLVAEQIDQPNRIHQKDPVAHFLSLYRALVQSKHPTMVYSWPLLRAYAGIYATLGEWGVIVIKDTLFAMTSITNRGALDDGILEKNIPFNKEHTKKALRACFKTSHRDAIILVPPDGNLEAELRALLIAHEIVQGLRHVRLFLSPTGSDKSLVCEFKQTLELVGFETWLEEDAMPTGANPGRAMRTGFEDFCAVVFFVTDDFRDEKWIAGEVEQAVNRKREDPDFTIITLVFGDAAESKVPDLLRTYVYKKPTSKLDALREILKALPFVAGAVMPR